MLKTQTKAVRIAAAHEQPNLSKDQKSFNNLTRKIEERRAKLAAWQEVVPAYQRQYSGELTPLIDASHDLQIELVHCLDRACDQKGLTATERRTIAGMISEMAAGLAAERDDPSLKNLYNKHSGSDFDEEESAAMEGMKSMLEDLMGLDLGDDVDMSSPEEFLKRAGARILEQQEQHEAEWMAQEERKAKRKTAKQIAKESRQQAEEQQATQSIRELYRKLASALHPDRESDPQERDRKTALMQRINQAYEQKNLLLLLELQLELEHIDQAAINNISAERLRHYNKILKEQLNELEHEICHTEDMFREQFGLSPFSPVSPNTVMRDLSIEIAVVQQAILELKNDLLVFGDIKKVKVWLKKIKKARRQQRMDFFDSPF